MKHLLSSTAFIIVNKKLATQVGLKEAILLADLISKEQYFIDNNTINNGWFFNTAKNIEKDTTFEETLSENKSSFQGEDFFRKILSYYKTPILLNEIFK